jgi:imidazole glycerol-phosphate synthase subunit HisH
MTTLLIDSPVANIANIRRALAAASADVTLSADPERIANAPRLVLPGVGSFAAAMRWLDGTGVADAVRSAVSRGALLLGVCVGHQVLFDDSEEDGQRRGLGILRGSVRRFSGALPVPQIGWNRVSPTVGPSSLFAGIPSQTPFYFVNSYRVGESDDAIAYAAYDGPFTAAVARDRVFGVQFHPEKSSAAGLRLLRNFVEMS